ncbi:alpha and gamma adaptin binding protein p34 [Diplocarpon rosae]|nr:alpha and gamma adaptin binding protein p34 [Diplocarpon rosae]
MEISNPRRILAVSRPDSGLLDLIEGLTGTVPILSVDSVAGTTHNYPIKTTYYTATIPVWLDEIIDPSSWSADFLAPEAREVLTVLGAFVVCFRKPINEEGLQEVKALLEGVSEVVKEGCGLMWDGVCLAVAMPQSTTPYLEKSCEEWEEVCQEYGFEFVDFEKKGRNEYSEPMGMERLREALEANDWEGSDELDEGAEFEGVEDDSDEAGSIGFGLDAADRAEMEREMRGIKQDIYRGEISDGDGDGNEFPSDKDVEDLQAMMLEMQAVRDLGADMPEAERKRFAAKAVNDFMKKM